MPAISIIVPVYNAEKYLHQCVDSILAQSFTDFELICVDDGSTDHSVDILKDYQQRDSRVLLIQQNNQYAGVARNNGMKVATGKYLMFLDSDDFFERNMLEEAYSCAERNCAQIVVFDYLLYDDKLQTDSKNGNTDFRKHSQEPFSSKDMKSEIFDLIPPVPWNKMFLRSYVVSTGIQFQEIKCCNDEFFNKMAVVLADRIVILHKDLVHYRINNKNSLQGEKSLSKDGNIDCVISFLLKIKSELSARHLMDEPITSAYNALVVRILSHRLDASYPSYDDYRFVCKVIKENLVPQLLDSDICFKHAPSLQALQDSKDFCEFLFTRNMSYKQELKNLQAITTLKTSKDYMLGHALLTLPRKIKFYIKSIGDQLCHSLKQQ